MQNTLRLLVLAVLAAAVAAAEIRLIIHADDLGMSHAANRASLEMLEKGWVSSASVMMPCAWVAEVAAWRKQHPDKDLGLHLTLTSEWRPLRWGPVAGRNLVPGLLDADGYMWPDVPQVARSASAKEVETELRAQIELARRMGIRFTHIDTHMGTLYARPDYFEAFEKMGREYGVPILRMKPSAEAKARAAGPMVEYLLANEERFRREGHFRLDSLLADPTRGAKTQEERREAYHRALRGLKPGVHMLILHPAMLDPEIRRAAGSAPNRFGDYQVFSDDATVKLIRDLGIQLVGWQDLAPAKAAN